MKSVLQSDRDFICDLLAELGSYVIDSHEIRNGRADHKTTVQMAVQRRLSILENIQRNRLDGVSRRLNLILNENEEALTVTVRSHIEAALRLCTLAALNDKVDDTDGLRWALSDLVSWFPESGPTVYGPWIIKSGEDGADDAVYAARKALATPASHASDGGKA